MKEDLVEFSHWCAQHYRLVQAGGGNLSLKISNEELLIKASGWRLGSITETQGLARVSMPIVDQALAQLADESHEREQYGREQLKRAQLCSARPSMETWLHALFPHRFCVHVHDLGLLRLLCQRGEIAPLREKLGVPAWCVSYRTPGIELALEIKNQVKEFDELGAVLMKNHGVLYYGNDKEQLKKIIENIMSEFPTQGLVRPDRFEEREKGDWHTSLDAQSASHPLALVPDDVVYWGGYLIEKDQLKSFEVAHGWSPRVFVEEGRLVVRASSAREACDILEVYGANQWLREQIPLEQREYLTERDVDFLGNWEAEKFRQAQGRAL